MLFDASCDRPYPLEFFVDFFCFVSIKSINIHNLHNILMTNACFIRLFHPVNSLVVSRNLWLILFSKILLFFNLFKHTSKNSKDSKSVLIFFSCFSSCWVFSNLVIFHKIKVAKHIWGTMLPPGELATESPHTQTLGLFLWHCTVGAGNSLISISFCR